MATAKRPTLNWSSLVVNGASSLTVNEKIYYRTAGTSTWTYLTSRSNHTINKTTPVTSSVDISPAFLAGFYDFRIEIYRNGIATPDYARDTSTDGDMKSLPDGREHQPPTNTRRPGRGLVGTTSRT